MLRSMEKSRMTSARMQKAKSKGRRKTKQCFVDGNDSTTAKGRDAEAKAKAIGFDLQKTKAVLGHSTL